MAEDLVVSGFMGAATVQVAALSRITPLSAAEPLVRGMLAEHGVEVPLAEDEGSEYQVLKRSFGYWDLPIYFFEGPFHVQIPAWDDQSSLDRALVTLLDQRDSLTMPTERASIEQEMRAVVRAHVSER
ncbi:hypothetical protein BJ980_002257 [Nocardioides daedukensis]|uniref:Uncharacterized protein n=1 Tax=Nocardioides daedukensis TaxID=634462 RepID=A0A7Y9S420_9ACTN|nr:hypothetical protein [Nocardioides daedukensis]NYG59334.1 hypothetical protein [Nocardioides daedukensis]